MSELSDNGEQFGTQVRDVAGDEPGVQLRAAFTCRNDFAILHAAPKCVRA